jgi:Flp pilus assembly protein TadD
MSIALFLSHRFEEAAMKLDLCIQDHPGLPSPYRFLAACYAQMGQLDEARAVVAKLRALTPLVFPNEVPYRNPEDHELYLSGLRMAAGGDA